jgi:hypothetical protein
LYDNAATEAGQSTVGKSESKMNGVAEGKLSPNSWKFTNYSFRSRLPRFKVKKTKALLDRSSSTDYINRPVACISGNTLYQRRRAKGTQRIT